MDSTMHFDSRAKTMLDPVVQRLRYQLEDLSANLSREQSHPATSRFLQSTSSTVRPAMPNFFHPLPSQKPSTSASSFNTIRQSNVASLPPPPPPLAYRGDKLQIAYIRMENQVTRLVGASREIVERQNSLEAMLTTALTSNNSLDESVQKLILKADQILAASNVKSPQQQNNNAARDASVQKAAANSTVENAINTDAALDELMGMLGQRVEMRSVCISRASNPGVVVKKEINTRESRFKRDRDRNSDSRLLHPCTDCGKTFSAAQTLKRHRSALHSEKPYVCPVPECGSCYTTEYNLQRHALTKHTCPNPTI